LSDQDSLAANPDRSFTAQEFEEQLNNNRALRQALQSQAAAVADYQAKCKQIDADLTKRNQEYRELYSQWQGLLQRNEVLEDEKKAIFREKKGLANHVKTLEEHNAALQDEVNHLRDKVKRLKNSPPTGPQMSGALPDDGRKLRRSESKKGKGKDPLAARFERSGESSTSAADSGTRRGRPSSTVYTEPWGRGGRVRSSSANPVRRFSTVAVAPRGEPVYSDLPRTRRQSALFDPNIPLEDGNYFPHPLR
jgi:hypothetical protein